MSEGYRVQLRRPSRRPAGGRALAALATLALLGGCTQPHSTDDQLRRGYILVLPGVESYAWTFTGAIAGLRDAGIDQGIELSAWGVRPFGTFPNLTHLAVNHDKAQALAARLVTLHHSYPDSPLTIIGYSGGGAIALWIAEAMPPDVPLEQLVLVAPAVSPGYDLRPALAHVRRGIVSFYSSYDRFILSWGTRLFGTMDRVRCDAAGHVGFQGADGKLLQDPRIRQIQWQSSWLKLWHDGSHGGWMSRTWSRVVLAPLLIQSRVASHQSPVTTSDQSAVASHR